MDKVVQEIGKTLRHRIHESESTLVFQPELRVSLNDIKLSEYVGSSVYSVNKPATALCGHQHVASTSMNNVEASSLSSRVPRIGGESTRQIDSSSEQPCPPPEYKHIVQYDLSALRLFHRPNIFCQLSQERKVLESARNLFTLRTPGESMHPKPSIKAECTEDMWLG
ncbi:hypothetical protein Tco_0624083 [Tanacetum coccineum]|uniref:Uncharacterized protein n=1 Tax=Tanacetum coccineum TaxID=301880 RepID=A0ABQ4WCY9_9ASTR